MAPTKEIGSFTNERGQKLHTVTYLPEGNMPDAVLTFHHGLGEYTERMDYVFMKIAEANIAVYAFDAHSQGKSEPQEEKFRAYFNKFTDLTDDQWKFISELVVPKLDGKKLFIGGHSLGGLISTTTAISHQDTFAGLIIHSAAINVDLTPVMRVQSAVGGLMNAVIPMSKLVPAVRPQDMSQDPKVVEAYLADQLIYHGNIKVRSGIEIQKGFKSLSKKYKELKVPIYAAHGTSDKCTSLPAVRRMLDESSSEDKTLDEVEGGYHELLQGPEKEECTNKIIKWLKAHI